MATLEQKSLISLGSAITFLIVNLPLTYRFTNSILPFSTFNTATNCPTSAGLLVHALVFFLITFLTMGNPRRETGLKVKYSLYGTLIFFLLSSPAIYSLTGAIFGRSIATNGCPTFMGVVLHSIVYFLFLVAVMYLPNEQ